METMKFGEPEASQEGENRKNTENNEPAPKAPEGVVLGVPRSAWPKNNNTP